MFPIVMALLFPLLPVGKRRFTEATKEGHKASVVMEFGRTWAAPWPTAKVVG